MLAIGAAQFGQVYGIAGSGQLLPQYEIESILSMARNSDIRTIDTAIAYGNSEVCLGVAGVRDFQVVTKLPPIPSSCTDVPKWVLSQVAESLSRLNLNCIYGLLLHRPGDLVGDQGRQLYRAICHLKDSQTITKWGVSIYSPSDLASLAMFELELVQAPLNIFDRRLVTSGWLNRLKDTDVEVHARSAFLQGLLTMPEERMPRYFSRWREHWERWYSWLAYERISPVEACLSFLKSVHGIDQAIVGVDSANQLAQLISAYSSDRTGLIPDFAVDDLDLINPSRWEKV